MKTLPEYIADAETQDFAIGHYNVANLEMVNGIVDGVLAVSKEIGKEIPVIIGASEGERDFMGIANIVSLVKSLRAQGIPAFLNADHTYSVERVKEAIDAGFDMVIFDGAELSHEENVAKTKECVEYARASGKNVLVEAELGYIGKGSDIKDKMPEGANLKTDPEEAKRFVDETGIHLFAPAVGNIHGIVKGGEERLDPPLITKIAEITGIPLVLHGSSGIPHDNLGAGVKAGIAIVHVSTELRVAYHEALKLALSQTEDLAPYKYLRPARTALQEVIVSKTKLFMGLS